MNQRQNHPKKENLLLHFTREPQQPWYKPDHPQAELWGTYLKNALDAEVIEPEEIEKAIRIFEPHTKQTRGQGMNPYWSKVL